jgi:hypothetical protein
MKKNSKGFLLLETMLVSTFVISTLVFLYIQFVNLKNSYDTSFTYNTIPGLYATKNIKDYIKDNNYSTIKKDVNKDTNNLIYIYNDNTCNTKYFNDTLDYCNELMKKLNVKKVIMTSKDLTNLKKGLKENDLDNELYNYIKKIKNSADYDYRLVAIFKDNTFTNLELN